MIWNVIFRPEKLDPYESCRGVKIYILEAGGGFNFTIYLTRLVMLSAFSVLICIKCKPVTVQWRSFTQSHIPSLMLAHFMGMLTASCYCYLKKKKKKKVNLKLVN